MKRILALAALMTFAACEQTAVQSEQLQEPVLAPASSFALIGGGAWAATGPGTLSLAQDGSSGPPDAARTATIALATYGDSQVTGILPPTREFDFPL